MNWYLNNWLTSWRKAINDEFTNRKKTSDGTIGDVVHRLESFSEHNPDADGSVDAYDMDVNLFGSNNDTGTADELEAIEVLKAKFQADPGSQLWIHNRQIANRDIGNWQRRDYSGPNDHKHHVHWQSRQSRERNTFAGNLDGVVDAINEPEPQGNDGGTMGRSGPKGIGSAPAWPYKESFYFKGTSHPRYSAYVKAWQRQMAKRGWRVVIDGYYGPKSVEVATKFQREKHLKADGLLGPDTFQAAWTAPITK